MASKDYQRFLDSMAIGFDQWHDGTGYDLEALERLGETEKVSIETLLSQNLVRGGDWRDVEALAALGTPSARAAVSMARYHANHAVRNYALGIALEGLRPEDDPLAPELEEQVIRAVDDGCYEMAARMPTPRVKQALLNCALKADGVTRVNAAALLLYLCGQTSEPFDWSQRPFFLRFAEDDPQVLTQAWAELRRRTGM